MGTTAIPVDTIVGECKASRDTALNLTQLGIHRIVRRVQFQNEFSFAFEFRSDK